jgi:hypothetical protein
VKLRLTQPQVELEAWAELGNMLGLYLHTRTLEEEKIIIFPQQVTAIFCCSY